MTVALARPGGAAAPGPGPALRPSPVADRRAGEEILLSVPGVRCAACIGGIEGGLSSLPGVIESRLNLSQRRLRVRHDGRLTPEALVGVLGRLGYEAMPVDAQALAGGADAESRDLLMRLAVAFFAMMNVMLLSVAVWSGAAEATRDAFHLVSGLIAVPTVLFSGQPFFRSAWRRLRAGGVNMDVPISLALILATSISLWESFHGGETAWFDAAVMLLFFLLAGRWLDARARAAARGAAAELAALESPRALRLEDGAGVPVAIADLRPGDLVLVAPGSRVPADGVVAGGESEVDRSLLSGETIPVAARPGTVLGAGETNLTGPLTLRVTAAGPDSSLARMAALVAVAEEARGRFSGLADRAARLYSPAVHAVSFAAFAVWMWRTGGDVRVAVNISAAVLIITCPCALGLAVPAVVTAASGRLFRKGLLVTSGTALERLAQVDAVVLDKTGTLTLGTPEPVGLDAVPEADLRVALALARGSAHPLARALARALETRGLEPAEVAQVREVPGHGIEGRWAGLPVRLGRAGWVGAEPGAVTETVLRLGDAAPRRLAFEDAARPGAEALLAALRDRGIPVLLLSGDVAPVVEATARRLGIGSWAAGLTPAAKVERVRALAAEGRHVLMVGDGLNDTAALAAAHVSVAPASGLDAARAASDIVLVGQSLAPLAEALALSRTAARRMRQNLALSALYNLVAVPVALVGLATPLMAAIAMSASSITVTLNALRLKR